MTRRLPRRRLLAGAGGSLFGLGALAGHDSGAADGDDGNRVRPSETVGTRDPERTDELSADDLEIDLEVDDLEPFVDDLMETHLADHDIVGAAVAVVHGDEVVFTNGYGETDAESETAVEADETVFRFGSVSKPFVWTAVMQLIEDGRIDPHEDVNSYLASVSIPETDDEPITMAHLATHTAGFEERFRGTWVDGPADVRPLPTVLSEARPERVRPPGEVVSYSNYGTALAAQVVADVTETPFEEYVERELLDPLGMDRSTFAQPLPDDLAVDAATGYSSLTGTPMEAPSLALELAPAGSLSATVTDVARLARAHLGDGEVDDERVLEAETVDRLHDQWFTHHEAIDGIAFGLFEDSHGDGRTLWHNGHVPGSFYTDLLFVPAADVGVVLAYNTDTGQQAAPAFRQAFLEEFLPTDPGDDTPEPEGRPERADELAGTYRGTRIAESTMARLPSTLQAGSVDVTVDDDGYLVTDFGGGPDRWVERDSLVFEERDGNGTLAFGATDGKITRLFVGHQAFEGVSSHESLSVHAGLAGATAVGMLSGVVGWPLARGWRWIRDDGADGSAAGSDGDRDENGDGDRESDSSANTNATASEPAADAEDDRVVETSAEPPADSDSNSGSAASLTSLLSPTRARWLAGGTIASLFGFLLGAVAVFLFNPYTLFSSPPPSFQVVSLLPIVGPVGTVLAAICTIQAWRDRWWGLPSRLHYTLVVLSMAGFCWLFAYWNFLGLPF
ncbi:serine hydrolase domain-containing protein [Natronobacterium gregoryi]|uniref:Beta-lactamase n=2 Tax=Natronobacterium gregoryi TaxID=44930 RepID=L0ADG6_NATGS|nr:serine hydrolase domain-containing protein [Natronobacterium gregoryi]AFZ71896.1 penicillin-binding protein, beta-lactamase class C [Natronobacterium gregoryi SP2]ELY62483.1 beta-lactamase [Natronobacterium gregoryi SP2]PLK20681.1 serine hydrolase [Natronobacterium gregoryi SP2]SFJ14580.1 CubicO group peptidase, beta-lactamase class C family [Natronobacterium gregoryi]